MFDLSVYCLYLQYFDTVGWVRNWTLYWGVVWYVSVSLLFIILLTLM